MTEEVKTAEPAPITPTEPEKTEQKPKPPGYEPVDFDALNLTPEQRAAIEPRIRYLYGNLKKGEGERTELRAYLDRLQKDIDARILPLEKQQTESKEAQYTAAIKLARDEGRVEDELKLTKELHKLGEPEPKPLPKKETEFWKPAVESWASEVDHENNLKRPWLAPDHPEHELALGKVHKLNLEWQQQGLEINPSTLPLFLNQLEQRMTKTNGARQPPAVLPTSQARPPAPKSTDLTAEEKYTADRMLSHIKEPEERYRRYASHRVIRNR